LARTVNPLKIGIFALICLMLIIGAFIWLRALTYFEDTKIYVSYFNESVKGLQKDAVVNYRGVGVGHVTFIGLAPDGRLVEVLIKLQSDFRVDQTIAIQLREQGLTGLQYLEIDNAPENIDQLTPRIQFPTKYPILRSYPSEIEQLKFALQDIYQKLSAIDLKALTDTWTRTAEMINNLLVQLGGETGTGDFSEMIVALRKTAQASAALLERISSAASQQGINKGFKNLSATLAATRQASETLASQLKGLPPDVLNKLSRQISEAVKSGNAVFTNLNTKIGDSSAMLEQDLQQLKVLFTQLNSLVESLRQQPNRLIFPSKQKEPFKKR
jgi:ABC-type transporter Mla subunit MlaD